jgi:hypothetical protein
MSFPDFSDTNFFLQTLGLILIGENKGLAHPQFCIKVGNFVFVLIYAPMPAGILIPSELNFVLA